MFRFVSVREASFDIRISDFDLRVLYVPSTEFTLSLAERAQGRLLRESLFPHLKIKISFGYPGLFAVKLRSRCNPSGTKAKQSCLEDAGGASCL